MGWFRPTMAGALALAVNAIAATASLAQPSLAQQWPTHTVRLVLPFGPGSGSDTAARLFIDKLQQKWGQPVIIGGKPGGDGLLSLQTVVAAKDDHVLYFGPSSMFVVRPQLEKNFCPWPKGSRYVPLNTKFWRTSVSDDPHSSGRL